MPRIRTFRPTAFTLIELLVVVVMLAVVLSLAVSATGKSRDQSRRAQCLEQLHLIGVGLAAYSADNAKLLPIRGYLSYNLKEEEYSTFYDYNKLGRKGLRFRVNIGLLYGSYCGTDLSLFYCPSNPLMYNDATYGASTFPTDATPPWNTWGGYMYSGCVPPACYPKDDGQGSIAYVPFPGITPLADYDYAQYLRTQARMSKRPYRGRTNALVIDMVIGDEPHRDGSNVLFSDYSGRWTPDYDHRVSKLTPTSGSGGRSALFEAWNVLSTRK